MRFLVLAVLALASFGACAGDGMPKSLDIPAIVQQQKQIQSDIIAERGRYKDLPPAKRTEVLSRQASMLQLLDGKTTDTQLSGDERMQVFNTLEWIEVAINQESDDDQMVCRREKPLGSTRTVRTCRTLADEREAKERARQELESNNNRQMIR